VIYLVEQATGYVEKIAAAISKETDIEICISPLVQMECMVGVFKLQSAELQLSYEQFFKKSIILDINPETFQLATKLRAQHGLKTPDALHLATAIQHECGQFWTNDDRLNTAAGERAVNLFE
jgi:predicted nucleic acid-binding protein